LLKEIYIDEASNLENLYYCHRYLDARLKTDFIQCRSL